MINLKENNTKKWSHCRTKNDKMRNRHYYANLHTYDELDMLEQITKVMNHLKSLQKKT